MDRLAALALAALSPIAVLVGTPAIVVLTLCFAAVLLAPVNQMPQRVAHRRVADRHQGAGRR